MYGTFNLSKIHIQRCMVLVPQVYREFISFILRFGSERFTLGGKQADTSDKAKYIHIHILQLHLTKG